MSLNANILACGRDNKSQHTLLSEGICPYVTNMRIINCYDFLKRKFRQIIVNNILKFIWLC